MTLLAILALQVLAVGASAATPTTTSATSPADGSGAGEKPLCESSRPEYGDTMQARCSLRASDAPRKFKFEVRFTGGHDDTMASLSATLNGKPLTCDEGSKTELMGEFGEVSLHCQFSSQDAQELKVSVQWHHAQYADFALDVL